MNQHLLDACESVDAAVFSGDVLHDDDSRNTLREYLGRWQRAIAEHERTDADCQSRAMFVARLENMQKNGDTWLTIPAVLALLNDCDMVATQAGDDPP